ncbi:MAG: hypothetical protein HYX75_06715 [Acidobacteria bacterium]|nr:hypothetical protein [Acidobacteriota bacterium]
MLPALGGIAAQLVAPMVSQLAGGLLQNLTKGLGGGLPGLGGGLPGLGGLSDMFSKIAGNVGQIFQGAQSMVGGLGGLGGIFAGRGMFPPLPFGPGMSPMPGCFGPRHSHVDININVKVNDRLGQILQPGGPFMKKMDDMMGKMQGLLDGLNKLTQGLGGAQQQGPLQGGANFLEQLGNLLKQLGVGGQQEGAQGAQGAQGGGGSVGGSQGGQAGAVGPESATGGGSRAGASSGDFGDKALSSAFDKMDSLESELDSLDMNSKDAPKKMMQIQQKMQKVQQMINTVNEMRKARHDMIMGVSRNLR